MQGLLQDRLGHAAALGPFPWGLHTHRRSRRAFRGKPRRFLGASHRLTSKTSVPVSSASRSRATLSCRTLARFRTECFPENGLASIHADTDQNRPGEAGSVGHCVASYLRSDRKAAGPFTPLRRLADHGGEGDRLPPAGWHRHNPLRPASPKLDKIALTDLDHPGVFGRHAACHVAPARVWSAPLNCRYGAFSIIRQARRCAST